MDANIIPFNIDLLLLSEKDISLIRPIKVQDIFDGMSKNFHPDGLFSTEIFGKVGEERRNRMFSYIDLGVEVFHPLIFKAIGELKSLYNGILSGKEFAIFNTETKDFEKSDPVQGQTGFNFFCKHFPNLVFEKRPSPKREFNIKLVDKYRNKALMKYFVVMPAGLRDYEIDANGKPSENEINPMYRKILAVSSLVSNIDPNINSEYLDSIRFNLQKSVLDIYEYITSLLDGKSKFVQGLWVSRKVFNSTRNVITSVQQTSKKLFDERSISTNQTIVGLYQFLGATMPLSVKHVRDTYLSYVFPGPNSPAILVNKTTLKKEVVNINPDSYDEWMTTEGLEKVLARFSQEDIRHDYLEVEGRYIGLIYKGADGTFKFMQDIDELPPERASEKKNVTPITFAELLYLSVFRDASSLPCFNTRYPIAGYGSIYPSFVYLKSTAKAEVRTELDDNWNKTEVVASEFPITGEHFFNSMSPANSHIGRLAADFDGDTMSFIVLYTEDSKEEIKNMLNSKNYYVGIDGKMNFSASTDIVNLILAHMTS